MTLFTRSHTPPPPADEDELARTNDPEQPTEQPTGQPRRRWPWRRTDPATATIWPDANRWGTKLFLAVLVTAVLCGPAALLVQLHRTQSTAPPAPTSASPYAPNQTAAEQRAAEAAAGFVEVWLTATADDTAVVTGLLVQPPERLTLPAKAPAHAATWPVRTTAVGPDQWSVTVRSQTDGAVAWWLVDVMAIDHLPRVITLPGQIPPPPAATDLDVQQLHQLSTQHPAAHAAAGFLGAMLTGADTTRWTSPNSALAPLQTPTCTDPTTEVASPAAEPPPQPPTGATLLVVATTTCGQPTVTYQYGLELRGRDGRWEIAAMTSPSHVMAARPAPSSRTAPTPSTPPASTPPANAPSSTAPTTHR